MVISASKVNIYIIQIKKCFFAHKHAEVKSILTPSTTYWYFLYLKQRMIPASFLGKGIHSSLKFLRGSALLSILLRLSS